LDCYRETEHWPYMCYFNIFLFFAPLHDGYPLVRRCVNAIREFGYNSPVRERSNIIWRFRGGGGLLKPSECRHIGGGGLAKSSYNSYSGWKKKVKLQFISLYLRYIWGEGLVKNVIWGRGSKIAQKTVIWYLNFSYSDLTCIIVRYFFSLRRNDKNNTFQEAPIYCLTLLIHHTKLL